MYIYIFIIHIKVTKDLLEQIHIKQVKQMQTFDL